MRYALIIFLWFAGCGQAQSVDDPQDAGADGPQTGFKDPVSESALVFELKGLINPYDSVQHAEKATYARGRFHLHKGGAQSVIEEDPMIHEYVYGENAGAKAGERILVHRAFTFHKEGSSSAEFRVTMAQVLVPEGALSESLETQQLTAEDGLSASLRDITAVSRADGVVLYKDCTRGVLDPKNKGSRLRVDRAPGQANLEVGQPLFTWGNLALELDPTRLASLLGGHGLELHQGQHCRCSQDGKPITCATFEVEAQKSGEELSCPVPDGFLDPGGSASHLALTFKGPINPQGAAASYSGLATISARVGGKPYDLSYRSHATRYVFKSGAWAGKEIVEVTSMGDVKTVAKDRYTFNALMTRVRVDLMQQMKAGNMHQPPPGTQLGYVAFLFEADQIYPEKGDILIRMCPVAVTATPPGEIHLCHVGNQSFAAGETLELAASLRLSGDPQEIKAWLGSECFCTKNGAAMSCDAYPDK